MKVRLAVGGTAGGKAVIATTDRSGAFTLRGLHSGSSYTLIAELEDEEGIMAGRAQVRAPQTDVRITLQPRDGGANQGHASIRPARPRVGPISSIESVDDEPSDESGASSDHRLNAEDLEPPAAEAAAVLSGSTARRGEPRRTFRGHRSERAGTSANPVPRTVRARTPSHVCETTAPRRPEDLNRPIEPRLKSTMMGRIHYRRQSIRPLPAGRLALVHSWKTISYGPHKPGRVVPPDRGAGHPSPD